MLQPSPTPLATDSDGDGCTDAEELGLQPELGGDRDPDNFWDFYDVTGERQIDLSDTLVILAHFGHGPADDALDHLKLPTSAASTARRRRHRTAAERTSAMP